MCEIVKKQFDLTMERPQKFLDGKHLDSDLKGRSARGGAIAMTSQAVRLVLQTGSTVVLARLLTPRDYGLVAMVTAATGFITLFKDLGLSMATLQKAEITHQQISTLFWINVALSALVMLVAMALSPAIAWFYGEPRLLRLTLVTAIGFLFGGLCAQHNALLRRQMRFGVLAIIDILQFSFSMTVGIVAAGAGAGVWALIFIPLSDSVFNFIAVWTVCRWRPSISVRYADVREMLTFGAHITGFNVINYLGRNLDNVLLGWQWGSVSLGLYSRAYSLLMLPIQQVSAPLTAVGVPTLSCLQTEPARFRSFYRNGLGIATMLSMPIVGFSFVAAEDVIRVVLGEQWIESVSIFRILAVGAFLGTTFGPGTGWVYIALGNVRRQLVVSIFSTGLLLIAFAIGLSWGPIGVAAAFSIHSLLWRIPSVLICFRGSFLTLTDFLAPIWRPAVASLVAAAVGVCLSNGFPPGASVALRLVCELVGYVSAYLFCWLLLPGGKRMLTEVLGLVRELVLKRRAVK